MISLERREIEIDHIKGEFFNSLLSRLKTEEMLCDIRRIGINLFDITGVILGYSSSLILIYSFNERSKEPDSVLAVFCEDISLIRCGLRAHRKFRKRNMDEEILRKCGRLDLDSIETLILSASSEFPILGLETDPLDSVNYYGHNVAATDNLAHGELVSTKFRLDGEFVIPLGYIRTVELHSSYIKAMKGRLSLSKRSK